MINLVKVLALPFILLLLLVGIGASMIGWIIVGMIVLMVMEIVDTLTTNTKT
jgi:hypothetical protein